MKTIKAILNYDVIVLNEVPLKAKIKASQITTYDGIKYFNPDKAVIAHDSVLRPSKNHKLKDNYQDFTGEDQWEIDSELMEDRAIEAELQEAYELELANLVWDKVKKNNNYTGKKLVKLNEKLSVISLKLKKENGNE